MRERQVPRGAGTGGTAVHFVTALVGRLREFSTWLRHKFKWKSKDMTHGKEMPTLPRRAGNDRPARLSGHSLAVEDGPR